jgi:DNA-binding CsgD family transcriptional regulator
MAYGDELRGHDAGASGGIEPLRPGGALTNPLTNREQEIAALVASGMSNREIGVRLFISKRTVDAHVEHIYGKLGISSRVQLTRWLRAGG